MSQILQDEGVSDAHHRLTMGKMFDVGAFTGPDERGGMGKGWGSTGQ